LPPAAATHFWGALQSPKLFHVYFDTEEQNIFVFPSHAIKPAVALIPLQESPTLTALVVFAASFPFVPEAESPSLFLHPIAKVKLAATMRTIQKRTNFTIISPLEYTEMLNAIRLYPSSLMTEALG